MAAHAAAAGDWSRAARGWLLAGEQALAARRRRRRGRAADPQHAPPRTGSATGKYRPGRCLPAAGPGRRKDEFAAAVTDIETAITTSRADRRPAAGDGRAARARRRRRGRARPADRGRVWIRSAAALRSRPRCPTGRPRPTCGLGSPSYAVNGLRFDEAIKQSRLAVRAARASGDERRWPRRSTGRRRRSRTWARLPPWCPFSTSWSRCSAVSTTCTGCPGSSSNRPFPASPPATGRRRRPDRRLPGITAAAAAWRMPPGTSPSRRGGPAAGPLPRRRSAIARHAVALTEEAPHVLGQPRRGRELGITLLETGDAGEAARCLSAPVPPPSRTAPRRSCCAAWRRSPRRPVRPLCWPTRRRCSTGSGPPPEPAFLAGDTCYLAIARGWLARDEPQRARAALAPLLGPPPGCPGSPRWPAHR